MSVHAFLRFKYDNVAWFTRFSPDGRTLAFAPGWGRMVLLRAPSLAQVDAQRAVQ